MRFNKNFRLISIVLCFSALLSFTGCSTHVTNPNYLLTIDEDNPISSTYTNSLDLLELEGYDGRTIILEKVVCEAFIQLKDNLTKLGITIGAESGFRTEDEQKKLYDEEQAKYNKAPDNETHIFRYPAPGYSEHQTGFALDYVIKIDSKWITDPDQIVKESDLLDTIRNAATSAGFTASHPNMPWHLRYVGTDAAAEIADRRINLKTYIASLNPDDKDSGFIYAYTVDEMLSGICPKSRVILNSNFYDLSTAENYGRENVSEYYHWEKADDGYNLVINDINDFVMESRDTNSFHCTIQSGSGCNHVLFFDNCTNIELEGITLCHNKDNQTEYYSIVSFNDCHRSDMTKCRIHGSCSVGIELSGCITGNFDFCSFRNCNKNGMYLSNSEDIEEMRGEFVNCGEPNIDFDDDCDDIMINGRYQ